MRSLSAVVLTAILLPLASGQSMRARKESFACRDGDVLLDMKSAFKESSLDAATKVVTMALVLRAYVETGECVVIKGGQRVTRTAVAGSLSRISVPGRSEPMYAYSSSLAMSPSQDPAAMRGGWNCASPSRIGGQASNPGQRLVLARSRGRNVLGFMIPDGGEWLHSNTPDEVDFRVDGGPIMTRTAQFGNPEIALDGELAAVLKHGMEVSISIFSEEGGVHRQRQPDRLHPGLQLRAAAAVGIRLVADYNPVMRRYMDLILRILQYVETNGNGEMLPAPEMDGYTPAQVHYHIDLCMQAGFVDARVISGAEEPSKRYCIGSLTWHGHEALVRLRGSK